MRVARRAGVLALTLLAGPHAQDAALASALRLGLESPPVSVQPLERVPVSASGGGTVSVLDGRGREYARFEAGRRDGFLAAGAAGLHTVRLLDAAGRVLLS